MFRSMGAPVSEDVRPEDTRYQCRRMVNRFRYGHEKLEIASNLGLLGGLVELENWLVNMRCAEGPHLESMGWEWFRVS